MKDANKGFTLIELMVVVTIIGILAAIAYPSYIEYIQRAYRAEGQALLTDLAARQERYYAQNNAYIDDITQLGLSDANSATHKYAIHIVLEDGSYTLTAQQQFNDSQCGNLTLNGLGVKGYTGTDKMIEKCRR